MDSDNDEVQAAIALSFAGPEAGGDNCKRARVGDSDISSALFPELGCDASEFLEDRGLVLRHGTSLALMSLVSEWLNSSPEFQDVDPSADWDKWSARRPGLSLYYAALLDPRLDGAASVRAVLRAVLDGVPTPTPPHNPRLIIDYVCTAPESRGLGLASCLVEFATRKARLSSPPANCYVLALEESCVYWMGCGYVLEEGEALNARLNVFNDTHLLRRQGDALDAGDPADLALAQEEEGEEEGEEQEAGGEEGGESRGSGRERDAEELEDVELRAALAYSLGGVGGSGNETGAR